MGYRVADSSIGQAGSSGSVALRLLGDAPRDRHPRAQIRVSQRRDARAIETAAFLVPGSRRFSSAGARCAGTRAPTSPLRRAGVAAAHQPLLLGHPCALRREPGQFATWAPATGRFLGAAAFAFAALLPPQRLTAPAARSSERSWSGRRRRTHCIPGLALRGRSAARSRPAVVTGLGRPTAIVGHWLVLSFQVRPCSSIRCRESGSSADRSGSGTRCFCGSHCRPRCRRSRARLLPVSVPVFGMGLRRRRVQAHRYFALLVGISREMLAYQRGAADAAVFEERRRLARELHDGLAQELAFIRSEGARLSGTWTAKSADGDRRRARARRSAHGDLVIDDPSRRTARRHTSARRRGDGVRMGAQRRGRLHRRAGDSHRRAPVT